uniref:Uncharacterized protein n=1 Tax=Anopheles farauti TaxID=69004 RepID=A0A182QT99_9DIPT
MYHRVTTGWLVVALAALYFPASGADLSTGHGCDTKSIAQAYLECLQYLNIGRQSMYAYDTAGANCLMRCIGLNTRWWDNNTGLNEPALLRFFRQVDASGVEKARACLVDQAVQQMDSCAAAYHTFRCYGDALGEVVAHAEYLVPRRDTIRQAVDDCAQMLSVSDDRLATCATTGSFLRVEDGTRLLRCIITRLGLYADTTGVSVDRLKLLMEDETSGLWTEQRAHDAKQCEQDLRELGADVCQVAAQSVEICYGRQAFEALWQVLNERYGAGVESFETDGLEQVDEGENDVEPNTTPKPRYRSLLIIAPEVYHFKVNSEQDADSTSEETAQNEVKSAEQEPAGQPQATSTTEAPVEDEKQHVVHKRSVMYPMLSEQLPLYTPYRPHPARFRRAVPLPPYHAAMVPMMNPHYCHPVVRRSIAMDPMYVASYQSFVPQRYVREVIPVVALDTPGPDELNAVKPEKEPLPQGMQMVPEDLMLVGANSAQSDDAPESNVLLAPEEPVIDDSEAGTPYEDPAATVEAHEVVTKSKPESTTELQQLAAPTPTPVANPETETIVPKHPAKPLVPITGTKLLQALHLAQILSRMEVQPSAASAKTASPVRLLGDSGDSTSPWSPWLALPGAFHLGGA